MASPNLIANRRSLRGFLRSRIVGHGFYPLFYRPELTVVNMAVAPINFICSGDKETVLASAPRLREIERYLIMVRTQGIFYLVLLRDNPGCKHLAFVNGTIVDTPALPVNNHPAAAGYTWCGLTPAKFTPGRKRVGKPSQLPKANKAAVPPQIGYLTYAEFRKKHSLDDTSLTTSQWLTWRNDHFEFDPLTREWEAIK